MRFVVCAAGGVATLLNVAKPLSQGKEEAADESGKEEGQEGNEELLRKGQIGAGHPGEKQAAGPDESDFQGKKDRQGEKGRRDDPGRGKAAAPAQGPDGGERQPEPQSEKIDQLHTV